MSTATTLARPEAFPEIRTANDARRAKLTADGNAGRARRANNPERFFYWMGQSDKARILSGHLDRAERADSRERVAAMRNADRIFFELNPIGR